MHRHLRRSIRTSQTVSRACCTPDMVRFRQTPHDNETEFDPQNGAGQSTILEYGVYSVVRRQSFVEMRLHL